MKKQPLLKLIAPFQRYQQSGEINFQAEDKLGALASLRRAYPNARCTELDGLARRGRVVVQCSTQQYRATLAAQLRLNLEARDRITVDRQVDALTPLLGVRVDH